MAELQKALADISAIRGQMARGTMFRGYGPATLGATGILAMITSAAQAALIAEPVRHIEAYLALWIGTASFSMVIIAVEAVRRSRHAHQGLADDMLRAAIEQFLPAIGAGALLTLVLALTARAETWMLPGLWQIVFGLGVFASGRSLPRPLMAVGVWYLATGLLCLGYAVGAKALSPWAMGFPFGIGQLLAASLLHRSYKSIDDEE